MTIFLCDWAERASLLVDDVNEAGAREVARAVAEGVEPSRVRALPPRVVVLELYTEEVEGEDGEALEELRTSPLPHVEEALFNLLDEDDGNDPPSSVVVVCGEEADDPDGNLVRCDRPHGHTAAHAFGGLTWGGR